MRDVTLKSLCVIGETVILAK